MVHQSNIDRNSFIRRIEYQEFVKHIEYNSLPLLDDTVTEVILENELDTTPSNAVTGDQDSKPFAIRLREDPSRVICPLCDEFPSLRRVHADDLVDSEELADEVYRVFHKNDGILYIYKTVNRAIYYPSDTNVIRSELTNLELFQGKRNIVQPAGVVVFRNPYTTVQAQDQQQDQRLVISGILMQYYSGGSLKDILSDSPAVASYPWERWVIQIATALSCMHTAGKIHMDIKPSNIVLDDEGNAMIIDISDIGGVTYTWRAPETRDVLSPIELPFESRRLYDTWTYGKLLCEIIANIVDSPYVETVKSIAARLMEDDPQIRMTLPEAISWLEIENGNIYVGPFIGSSLDV